MGEKRGDSESGYFSRFWLFLIYGAFPKDQTGFILQTDGGLPARWNGGPYSRAEDTYGPPKSISENGPKMAISQPYLNEISKFHDLQIRWPFPYIGRSCQNHAWPPWKVPGAKTRFFPKPLFGPYLATLDPLKVVSGWPKPLETPDT